MPNPEVKTLFTDHLCRPNLVRRCSSTLGIAEHEQSIKRLRLTQSVEEITCHMEVSRSLPRTFAFSLYLGSTVTAMDFHPSHHTWLLAGSHTGDVSLWEVAAREKLVTSPFEIWDLKSCSLPFQTSVAKEAPFSVSRVTWSPDGLYLGAAFTKHLVHLYGYAGQNDLRHHLEIDAHSGAVNDLAFNHPDKKLCIITCGDDKLIKVWDLTGQKLFQYEGHEAPVYSICPHLKENYPFILSTAIDGKIKGWLYGNRGSRVDYDAPGHRCATMLYSADGNRLFSCGTGKDGDSFLVEWNDVPGAIKRTYTGFRKKSTGVAQFDTTQNHYLAVGEDSQIKFWDMDSVNMITSTDANGDLPSHPRMRFNKEGNLLAVSTSDNRIKLLANDAGFMSLRSAKNSPVRPSPILNGIDSMPKNTDKPRTLDEVNDTMKPWQLTEVVEPVHCRMITIPESTDAACKVAQLLYYTHKAGDGLLTLGSNGILKFWKWTCSEQNPNGKATANHVPCLWKPKSGPVMRNDVSNVNFEEAVPCIALSKNNYFLVSAIGGEVSLFNLVTFKVKTTLMAPPPSSTFLAFHPQHNNIIAIGMEDSTIIIFDVNVREVKSKLEGHGKRVTGLAFSTSLKILVSSGADGQLCEWNIHSGRMIKSVSLQLPAGKTSSGDTRVQFHSDSVHLLVSNESQLAIYNASNMDRLWQWVPQDVLSAPISSAVYSCDSLLVYASFCDGHVGVFDADTDTLTLRCRVSPSAYLSQSGLNRNQSVYPLVIASHPQDRNQFAIGLSDGSVKVIEPPESEGKWGEADAVPR